MPDHNDQNLNFPYNPKRKTFQTVKNFSKKIQKKSPKSFEKMVHFSTGYGINSIYYKGPSTIKPKMSNILPARSVSKIEKGNIFLENLKNKVKRQALDLYAQRDADL